MNAEVYREQNNARYGTKFNMPVVYYGQLLSVAYGTKLQCQGVRAGGADHQGQKAGGYRR